MFALLVAFGRFLARFRRSTPSPGLALTMLTMHRLGDYRPLRPSRFARYRPTSWASPETRASPDRWQGKSHGSIILRDSARDLGAPGYRLRFEVGTREFPEDLPRLGVRARGEANTRYKGA